MEGSEPLRWFEGDRSPCCCCCWSWSWSWFWLCGASGLSSDERLSDMAGERAAICTLPVLYEGMRRQLMGINQIGIGMEEEEDVRLLALRKTTRLQLIVTRAPADSSCLRQFYPAFLLSSLAPLLLHLPMHG